MGTSAPLLSLTALADAAGATSCPLAIEFFFAVVTLLHGATVAHVLHAYHIFVLQINPLFVLHNGVLQVCYRGYYRHGKILPLRYIYRETGVATKATTGGGWVNRSEYPYVYIFILTGVYR